MFLSAMLIRLRQAVRAVLFLFATLLPVVLGPVPGIPTVQVLGPISSTIILQAMPIVGLYSSTVIGWILRWDRGLSLLFITIGWVAVTVFLILVALGFVHLFAW